MWIKHTLKVKDIMSGTPVVCSPDTPLKEVALRMVEQNIGAIPVVSDDKPVGVITDRDITCRLIANNLNPLEYIAEQCMTANTVTVTPETSLDECLNLMEQNQIRRVIVVDKNKQVCGVLSQADIALKSSVDKTAKLVESVSQPVG